MASKDEAEENYWPGYVDALTTMTMVLTFVMMVLALAVFILSQNVSPALVEDVQDQAEVETPSEDPQRQKPEDLAKPTPQSASSDPDSAPDTQARIEAERITDPTDDTDKVQAASSESVLVVTYENVETRLNDATRVEVANFTAGNAALQTAKTVQIHAFAAPQEGGLTQSRRLAYYRGMLLRGELIANGIEAERIKVKVIETEDAGKGQTVEVFAVSDG